mgnify:CR=1 FL=1
MDLQLRPLTINLAALNGLSEELILSHHANNYTGAVKRLDAIRQQLAHLDWPTAPVFMINGLKREELIAANSAWLHELYFDTLGGDGALPDSGLAVALARDFGSVDRWRTEFSALAKAMGGSVTIPGEGNAEAHSSGSLSAMIGCNCLVELPAGSGPVTPGEEVEVLSFVQ